MILRFPFADHQPASGKGRAPSGSLPLTSRVISLGGATEASIWYILYPIERVEPDWTSIPYGKPMVNQTFHVLNESLAALPKTPIHVWKI
jgi:non-ribosomal peptide synthetase component F